MLQVASVNPQAYKSEDYYVVPPVSTTSAGSRLQFLATQTLTDDSQKQFQNPGSPPTLTGSTHIGGARVTRPVSLVTNSVVTAETSNSCTPISGSRPASSSPLITQKASPMHSRSIGILQTSGVTRVTPSVSNQSSTVFCGPKTNQSPQTGSTLRLSCSPSGHRILIQHGNSNSRSVLVQPAENTVKWVPNLWFLCWVIELFHIAPFFYFSHRNEDYQWPRFFAGVHKLLVFHPDSAAPCQGSIESVRVLFCTE